ncbi:MAG: H(+)/Cl(-) exchange transporter ClcA [Bacillota bacterium]
MLCLAAASLTRRAPEAAGSGIPHVEAVLAHEDSMVWWRVLPVKFIGGLLAITAGLSLGREGPTVQMGAASGQAMSRAMRCPPHEELQLIACGAGAGLSAAFNAPLAGVVFVLEELRRNFSPYVLGGALVASCTANALCLALLGQGSIFRLSEPALLPLSSLPCFFVFGLVLGLLGTVFNSSLLATLAMADRFPRLSPGAKAGLAAALAGILGYFLPQVLGGGHELIVSLLAERMNDGLLWLMLLLAAKFLLTMVSYGTGLPGGIFLPLLTLGALAGAIYARLVSFLFPGLPHWTASFVVMGMAGHFVAVVRAPLTGIVLITEMTGKYQHMLPLLLTCLTAYVVAEALGSLPVYEALLERQLAKKEKRDKAYERSKGTILIEMAVETGSPAANRRLGELALPAQALVVAVRRGSQELIPRGHSTLLEGDVLHILLPQNEAFRIRRELARLLKGGRKTAPPAAG